MIAASHRLPSGQCMTFQWLMNDRTIARAANACAAGPPAWILLAIAAALHVAFGLAVWLAPNFSASIPASAINSDQGASYIAPLSHHPNMLYVLPRDTLGASKDSRLALFENGKPLGPGHAAHAGIRQQGGGRYSHWYDSIYFSASDGSDPRTNGRVYAISSPTTLRPELFGAGLLVLASADACLVFIFGGALASLLRSHGAVIGRLLALGLIIGVGLSALGVFGTVTVADTGAPKDNALLLALIEHAGLGVAVSLGVWMAAAGLAFLAVGERNASMALILLPAFPIALGLFALLAAVALLVPHGKALALATWLACLLPLLCWRPAKSEIVRFALVLLGILPFAGFFGLWMGLLWHGPTEELAGYPSGDLVFYATSMWSLATRPYPFTDFASANAGPLSYFNMLYSLFGAALIELPGFDSFLYILAAGGTSFILFSGLALHLYVSDRAAKSLDAASVLILLLSLLAAPRYPYWVAESPPIIYLPALTTAVWWMAERGRTRPRWAAAALFAGLAGSALSKVVTAAVLVPAAAVNTRNTLRQFPTPARIAIWVGILAFSAYALFLLLRYLPIYLRAAKLGPNGYLYPTWRAITRDVATLGLVVLSFLTLDFGVALALTLGFASALAYAFLFNANFGCAVMLLGLICIAQREKIARYRWFVVVALALTLPAPLLDDPAGASSGMVWVVSIGGMVAIALICARPGRDQPIAHCEAVVVLASTMFCIGALGLLGVARGNVIANSGWNSSQQGLSPQARDIWLAVRRLTPAGALIFTDQVSDEPTLLGGWNFYALIGQRQIFLSSFYMTNELRTDATRLRRVLSVNDAVLRGVTKPSEVGTAEKHTRFFAVVSRSRAHPPSWERLYENQLYGLYGIPP
jgi:hypothetical protein